jgi:hypothetical protein
MRQPYRFRNSAFVFILLGGFEAVARIASDRVMARQHSAKSSNLEKQTMNQIRIREPDRELPPDYVIKTLTIAARKGPPPKKPSGWKYIKSQEKESAADFARRCRSAGLGFDRMRKPRSTARSKAQRALQRAERRNYQVGQAKKRGPVFMPAPEAQSV